ncbi:MAG: NAD(+)/NADH kinase [Bacilli bacterium]
MKISFFSVYKDRTTFVENQISNLLNELEIDIDNQNPDVIICIGGDGTFLKAIQNNLDRLNDVCFLGINNGKLGYFYDYTVDEIQEALSDLDNGRLVEKSFSLLEGTVVCENETYDIAAVNEIKISSIYKTLECEVFINEEKLENFAGNGLIVSSQLGSTALNKSVGGAIIETGVPCLELTPIAPVTNNLISPLTNPLILKEDVDITIKGKFSDALVSFDNVLIEDRPLSINVKKSSLKVKILLKKNHSFIGSLKRSFIK